VRVKVLAAVAFLAAAPCGRADDDALVAAVDAIAADALQRPVAGLSVAVGRGGAVLMAKGYGFANVELEAPARADTVYHVDSITKFLTAAAILKLAEEGRLDLEDDVGRWVPGFSTAQRPIRIRHLLSHTSGLPSYTSLPGFAEKERLDLSHEEVLAPVRLAPAHFAPGEGWRYCNTGFYLLGMVIEKVTGQGYADHMKKQLFEPLGMADSSYGDTRPLIRNRASGYEVEQGRLVNAALMSWGPPFSGGGIVSTALDLLKWTDGLAHGRVLKAASVERMWSPSRLTDGSPIDYGLGTRLGTLSGHRMVGHTGNGGGFRNVLLFFPEDDLTVAVLTNTDVGGALGVAARVARAVLRLSAEPRPERPLPAGAGLTYSGTYDSDEGRVTLFERDGALQFREKDEDVTGIPLAYLGDGTFQLPGGPEGRFVMKNGRVRANTLYTDGLFMDAMMRVP
jgi:CubicO group peptidase (beta-lactamase class C family)